MMTLPYWSIKPLHYFLVALATVTAFAPELPGLQLLVPANVYHAASVVCAVALWLSQSPLLKPLLSDPALAAKRAAAITLSCLCLTLTGCISSAPTVAVTAANSAQIATCQSDAVVHNGFVIGDFVFSGATPVLAGVAAALPSTDATARTALGVAAVITGGVAVATSGLTAFTAAAFANSGCSAVVGALPAAPLASKRAASAQPEDYGITVTRTAP